MGEDTTLSNLTRTLSHTSRIYPPLPLLSPYGFCIFPHENPKAPVKSCFLTRFVFVMRLMQSDKIAIFLHITRVENEAFFLWFCSLPPFVIHEWSRRKLSLKVRQFQHKVYIPATQMYYWAWALSSGPWV